MIRFKGGNWRTRLRLLSTKVPAESDVVVIGGGAIGAATLYHLTKQHGVSATLLERDKITSGTTWHSAGLIWSLRPTDVDCKVIARTVELCRDGGELEQLTGDSCGFKQNGGLFLATKKERMDEYKRFSTFGKYMGIESHLLTPAQTKDLYPLMNIEDIYGSLYSPGDGSLDPTMYTTNLIKAAKMLGATVVEMCPVTGIETEVLNNKKRVVGVHTNAGYIKTNKVVNCCGSWSPYISAMVGVPCPLITLAHTNITTDRIPGMEDMPNIRDHDLSFCGKVQGGGMLIGGYEMNPDRLENDCVAEDMVFGMYDTNWDVACFGVSQAIHRVPVVAETPIKVTLSGPESFTADCKPLIGEFPELQGFYLACGFNSAGLMNSGTGEEVANYLIRGCFEKDMFAYSTARFHRAQCTDMSYIFNKSHETYGFNYSTKFRYDESLAGRDLRKDALHDTLLKKGCVYQTRHGVERPGWFAADTTLHLAKLPYDYYGAYDNTPHEVYGYRDLVRYDQTFEYPPHHHVIGEEVGRCVTEGAVFNLSSYGKFILSGPQSQELLEKLCCTDVVSGGTTWLLNSNAGIEAQITVIDSGDGGYFITTDTIAQTYVYSHIKRVIEKLDMSVQIQDVTDEYGLLSVQGPNSKAAVQSLADQQGCICYPASELGLPGYHILVPATALLGTYTELMSGSRARLHDAGFRAYDSLACEQGSYQWHSEVNPGTTPIEAGITTKQGMDYIGANALQRQLEVGVNKMLVKLAVQCPVPLNTMEAVYRNGRGCGFVCRAAYGHLADRNIALSYVEQEGIGSEYVRAGEYEVETMGVRYQASLIP